MENSKRKYYAVYWGEQILTHGTAQECAAKLGIKATSVQKMVSKDYKERLKKRKGKKEHLIAIVVEDLDEMGN